MKATIVVENFYQRILNFREYLSLKYNGCILDIVFDTKQSVVFEIV